MTVEEFQATLTAAAPPPKFSHALAALWWDARGDWEQSHESAQTGNDRNSAWVHAYLHRKEGDEWNAGYWYSKAGKPVFTGALEAEAAEMLRALLD